MDSSVHKQLHFKSVNAENRREVEGLTVFSEQAGFIESVSECLREADELELWRPVGIYDSDTLIGFAMYGYFPEPAPGQLWLDRLLIDKKYQGKGYGKQAVELALRFIRTFPCGKADSCWLSYEPENTVAKSLYASFGFIETGEKDGEELIAVLKL